MRISSTNLLMVAAILLAAFLTSADAGQGCPFDDGSCQEYCNQQGCNMGYCGHFAWIQCICRKCGDEWSWYDKVRYNPDKTVNQTELDSLKLNNTNALILTNSSAGQKQQQQQQAQQLQQQGATTSNATRKTNETSANEQTAQVKQETQKQATLTTLLIPDLSDNSRLDLNDIPDENSDKFLDYLAKNHEKLVQATSAQDSNKQQSADKTNSNNKSDDENDEESEDEQPIGSTLPTNSADDDTIEIQISTSNNNTESEQKQQSQQQVIKSEPTGEPSQETKSPITRLLKLAVMDEVD